MEENTRKWQAPGRLGPETGQETFQIAQIAVSEVLGLQRLDAAVICAIVACTKRELKAAIFKTGGKPIQWQKHEFKDCKEGQFLKTAFYFSVQISWKFFSCLLVRILTKKRSTNTCKRVSSQNNIPNETFIFLRNHVTFHTFRSQFPNLECV